VFLPKDVLKVLNKLNDAGYESYVVGGAVRDHVMGLEPHDYDITTSALPSQIKEVFPEHFALGEKFGTISVITDSEPIEVTTFRKDSDYSDGRHPDKIEFVTSVYDDLCRRDFTMNAIAFNPKTGFVDPFNGIMDIENKLIRCVNNPIDRFNEDGLRILRAARFAAKLGFDIEQKTLVGMQNTINMLDCVAEERIGPEFVKILMSDHAEKTLHDYAFVIKKIIPEYCRVLRCKQNNPHHIYTLEGHTLKVVENVPKKEIVRLAAFFHDIGKPYVMVKDKDGIEHFPGHARKGAELTEKIMTRLRFSSKEIKDVSDLVKYHDSFWKPTKRITKNLLSKLGDELFFDIVELRKADILAQASKNDNSIETLLMFYNQIKEENSAITLKDLAIDGNDLINECHIHPSPLFKKVLNTLLEMVMDEVIKNDKAILLEEAKKIIQNEKDC